jgi:hypothetical protein
MSVRLMVTTVVVLAVFSAPAFAQVERFGNKPYEAPLSWDGRGCNQQGSPDLCLPLDGTWIIPDFGSASVGCSGEASAADPCGRNDDDYSSAAIPLNFTFDLYGTGQTSVYVNNNGNISFGNGYCTYTASGFPIADYPMVAPFWGDVDTRAGDMGDGVTWYKSGPNYFAVTWDHVGYYNQHADLQCTFQLIISDGTYAPMGLGNNVCFCYGDMNWTTGDASGGSGGFGGSPAVVGVNKGNGIDYFLIGSFDHPGTDYDGPGGAVDGVDYLDGRTFCFNVSSETNQPPVGQGFPLGDEITMCMGQVLELTVAFIGPEAGQTVTTVVDDGGLANFTYVSTPGNPSTVEMTFSPQPGQEGLHLIHFTASDDYDPPGVTERWLTIDVRPGPSATENVTWGTVKTKYRKRR